MAITFVGSTTGAGTGASYSVSLNGTLTGGSDSSPSPGDVVVVFTAFGHTASVAPGVSGNNSGSYTGVTASHQYGNDSWDTCFWGMYKRQGSTVDTSLTITRQNTTTYGGATVVMVWRGVDPDTPIDATPTTATQNNANTCLFNAPSITPATEGAIIIAAGAGTMPATSVAYTGISGMDNFVTRKGDGSTSDTGVGAASIEWTSGAYDPPIVSGGTPNASSSWVALSMALRPEPAPEVDLAGNSTRTNHTSTTGSVTQTHALTGNSVASSNTSTTGGVAQTHVLTGNSVAQPTTTTTGVVTSQTTADLTGSSTRTNHTSTTGSVSQTHILTGNSARQNTTSTTGGVSSAHALAGNSTRTNHTSTTGSVSSTHVIAGNSVRQNTTSTTGAVGQTHVLTGNSVRQNTTSTTGAVDLSYTHWLGGNSVAQPTTSTNGAVIQTINLTGNSVRQNTTSTAGAIDLTLTLIGNSVAQPNTSTNGSVQQVLELTGNSIVVGHTATTGGVTTEHNLTGDWVREGWVESGHVLSASAVQRNTSTSGAAQQTYFTPEQLQEILAYIQEHLMVPTPEQIAAAILAAAQVTPIHANMEQTNSIELKGDGTESDKFRSVLVP